MKLKMDADGHAVVQDGKPVYVHDDGKELPFDAPSTIATISRLNGEAKGHREAKEAAEAKLKAFDGITDAEAAKKALNTVANLDSKKLIDAGEVEKVKGEIAKSYEAQLAELGTKNKSLETALYGEKIGGAFARSKFISEKVAVPSDLIQAQFGARFKIEDGKTVAYDATGNKLYSRAKPGELADFEEALELIIDAYPHKDHILKGTGSSGSGSRASTDGNGGKTMKRAAFDALDVAGKAQAMKDKIVVTD